MFDDELRELYQEVILDHGRHPRNFRHPPEANRHASGHNPLCGDKITIYLTLSPDGIIQDAAFEGKGCAISQASASLMTETVRGKTVAEAEALFGAFHDLCTQDNPAPAPVSEDDLDRLKVLAGVRQFPMRVKCATLSWHALHAALADEGTVSTE
ncbi:MAG: SUF system NifU family Fe-S cluster assembly protein [Pseudomonadota bacterium]|nr:SUF system NifU family Fe-S cluster assembly protein [Pseudomonadota bacterium]